MLRAALTLRPRASALRWRALSAGDTGSTGGPKGPRGQKPRSAPKFDTAALDRRRLENERRRSPAPPSVEARATSTPARVSAADGKSRGEQREERGEQRFGRAQASGDEPPARHALVAPGGGGGGGKNVAARDGEPPAKYRKEKSVNAASGSKRVSDVLPSSTRFIDNTCGTNVRKLQRGQTVSLQAATEAFLARDNACPGPYTLVYLPPPKKSDLPPPPPARDIEQLLAYTHKSPYVDLADDAPKMVKDTVNHAWKVLAQSGRQTEPQKQRVMAVIHSAMIAVHNDDSFEKIFILPTAEERY